MASADLAAAFLSGMISFVSPCVLPLVPSFLSYLSGISIKESGSARARVLINTFFFVLGLVAVLTGFGFVVGELISSVSGEQLLLIGRISGALMVLFGLYVLGFVKVSALERHKGIMLISTRYPPLTSFLIGAAFAFAWAPLMGAFLAFLITLSLSNPSNAPLLMFSFACGLGVPFILSGAFLSAAADTIRKRGKELAIFNKAMGMLVIIIGLLIAIGVSFPI